MKRLLYQNWFRLGMFNLMIVALYGTLMRYKIAFNFPFLEQKNLLHAHAYFALTGWLSHILYGGMAMLIHSVIGSKEQKKYNFLIVANIVVAFGILISFTLQGYGIVSSLFILGYVVVAILFTYFFIKDSKKFPPNSRFKPWAIMGLVLNVVSVAGLAALAYMIIAGKYNPNFYLASVYYHLHFQYNGWFFFAGVALITTLLPENFPGLKKYFILFAITVFPTFFLSILWAKLPMWLYVITVIASVVQLGAWISLIVTSVPILSRRHKVLGKIYWFDIFRYAAAFAMTVKFILQTISVIPSLSQLVFGFRSIVIAYLHLILLAVYSLFLFGFAFRNKYLRTNKVAKIASFSFLIGVFLNEAVLGVQGIFSFSYTIIPYINETLFGVALLLFLSMVLLLLSQLDRHVEEH